MADPAPPPRTDVRGGLRFLRELDLRLERLDRQILLADWNLQTGRSPAGSERWQLQRSALLSEPRLVRWVRSAPARSWPGPDRRRLELLERITLEAQVEQHPEVVRLRSPLERRIVAFRPTWNGRRVNRAKIHDRLQSDPDRRARRRAFYALEPLYRSIEPDLRALVRARNDRARAFGFRSFAEMRLGFQGVSPSRLEELADHATRGLRPRLARLRTLADARETGSGWAPWDLAYARARAARLPDRSFPRGRMLATILRAVAQWGFRTDRMRFRVVFHDLPAGGLTLAPDPPTDVRILVHPRGGWSAYRVMFHEVGHAVQSASIRAPRHLLRWHENVPGFGGFHEGIGSLFESIARDPAWLAAQPGIDPAAADRFAGQWRDAEAQTVAWTVPWLQVEQALYRDPEGDPTRSSHRLERRLFGFDEFPARSFADSFWVEAPSYAPNYLLATLFHYQIARSLRERFGETLWPNRRVGPWLARAWFAPGSLYDWVPRLRELTGRPFGARDFSDAIRRGG